MVTHQMKFIHQGCATERVISRPDQYHTSLHIVLEASAEDIAEAGSHSNI